MNSTPTCNYSYHLPFDPNHIVTDFPVENAERDAERIFREHGFGLITLIDNQGVYSAPTTHDYEDFSAATVNDMDILNKLTTYIPIDSRYDAWLARGRETAWTLSEGRHDQNCFNASAWAYATRFNDRMMDLLGAKPDAISGKPGW